MRRVLTWILDCIRTIEYSTERYVTALNLSEPVIADGLYTFPVTQLTGDLCVSLIQLLGVLCLPPQNHCIGFL